jgi:hypothetical protein
MDDTQMMDQTQMQAAAVGGMVGGLIGLAVAIIMVVCMWRIFTKAGKPGWASLIPIYNIIMLLEIIGRPLWNIILFVIPFANIYMFIMLNVGLAKRFGKGTGFAIGMIFLPFIFFPILAFS